MFAARGGQLQRTRESNRFGNGGVNHHVKVRVAELLEHFAGVGWTRADVAVDKPVGRSGQIFSQSHSGKLRFTSEKSELEFLAHAENTVTQ
jgi:hypothetical protein